MSGFFGCISKEDCVPDVSYGNDYHSHLGTKRAGVSFYSGDNVRDLHHAGIKEVHMRIACPPLTYPCEFLNFSRSRSNLDMATHKAVEQIEGIINPDMKEYSDSNHPKYHAMVEQIRKNLDLTTLKFQKLDDLVEAIGLPKEKLCTHCWDGSSYF